MGRKPLAWSYSALSDFVNCPRAYFEKKVAKSVQEAPSEQMIWGNKVHKHFENRMKHGTPLPDILSEHEPYMQELERIGQSEPLVAKFTETKIGLNKALKPCGFFDRDVWWRGVIDYGMVGQKSARLVDYKTGKKKDDFKQLTIFALHTFIQYPHVEGVDVCFYWTKTKDESAKGFHRREMGDMWAEFIPDLKQYKEAFATDTWQPRQSGLCHGWCPVEDCEFWRPKKRR